MLVMPLSITHVDTKVLVLLVQAIPTSLHIECEIQRTSAPVLNSVCTPMENHALVRSSRLTQTLQSVLHSATDSKDLKCATIVLFQHDSPRSPSAAASSGIGKRVKVREYVCDLILSLLTNEMSCNLWDQLHNDPVTVRRCFLKTETPNVS